MRGDGVSQTPWIVDAGDRRQNLRRDLLVEFDVLVKLLHHGAAQGLDFAGLGIVHRLHRHGRDGGEEMRFRIIDGVHLGALLALDQHLHGAVGQLEHLQDGGHAAHLEHIFDRRFILGGRLLRDEHDAAIRIHRQFQRLDALGSSHEQWNDHVREHHDIPKREQRQINGGCGQWSVSGHE
ncbi:hypothetical protein SDC9_78844 [bioreactor metagenome]|uniref:Uncharacterized protein n=1 Tax=bioreactor metagenome TaxID=1076179 RepID=A0A644YUP0_9ZZZZ